MPFILLLMLATLQLSSAGCRQDIKDCSGSKNPCAAIRCKDGDTCRVDNCGKCSGACEPFGTTHIMGVAEGNSPSKLLLSAEGVKFHSAERATTVVVAMRIAYPVSTCRLADPVTNYHAHPACLKQHYFIAVPFIPMVTHVLPCYCLCHHFTCRTRQQHTISSFGPRCVPTGCSCCSLRCRPMHTEGVWCRVHMQEQLLWWLQCGLHTQ
jgi:hypothetical protein